MNKLYGMALALGDRLNPVAVREFRQSVQVRGVIVILMLFLTVNLCAIGGYLTLSPNAETSTTAGRDICMFLLGVLFVTCIGLVPLYVGFRMSRERNDANADLLFITTLSPGAIVRGKYSVAMAITLLIFSICTPFLTVTYLLRGVDLPTIFFVLGIGLFFCTASNALGVVVGSVGGTMGGRVLVGLGALFCLFYMVIGSIAMSGDFIYYNRGMFYYFGTGVRCLWFYITSFLLFDALAIGLCYVLATAMLSVKTSNRMFVPRLYITGCWIISGVIFAIWCYLESTVEPIAVWAVICGVCLSILLVTTLGERDSWTARVRRKIPDFFPMRVLAFLTYTGSAGGLAWWTLLFIATLSITLAINFAMGGRRWHPWMNEALTNVALIFGYVLCYCLTIAFLRLSIFRRLPSVALSVMAAFLGVVVCLGPYFTAFFFEHNSWNVLPWYLLGSPMVLAMSNREAIAVAPAVVAAWLLLSLVVTVPWGFGQWLRFTPHKSALPPVVPSAYSEPVLAAELCEERQES